MVMQHIAAVILSVAKDLMAIAAGGLVEMP
jgi:hypothetical protein